MSHHPSPIEQLVEQLKSNPGSTLMLDNDAFFVHMPGYYELPDEDLSAQPGEPLHWLTIEREREKFVLPSIDGADMPLDLLQALAMMLGFKVEWV